MRQDVPDDPSLDDPLPSSPLELLRRWLDEARERRVQRNPDAMVVATLQPEGDISARVVLCRGYDAKQGLVVFYTNRSSRKGVALASTPRAAAVLHWDALQRQVCLEGPVVPSPDSESDRYFASRSRPAQVAAWATDQSQPIASRKALLARLAEADARFEDSAEPLMPRPPVWGGYRLFFERVELWVGAEGRAHDRALWTRELTPSEAGFRGGPWTVTRLQP